MELRSETAAPVRAKQMSPIQKGIGTPLHFKRVMNEAKIRGYLPNKGTIFYILYSRRVIYGVVLGGKRTNRIYS